MHIKGLGDRNRTYEIMYCCRFLVLLLLLSFLNAQDSIWRTLSRLTPINSPISCSVFILPFSSPNLSLITCFSLGFKVSSTLCSSSFMKCLMRMSSDVSASGSAITSYNWSKIRSLNEVNQMIESQTQQKGRDAIAGHWHTEGFRFWLNPIFWSRDIGAFGESNTVSILFIGNPVISATSSRSGYLLFSL